MAVVYKRKGDDVHIYYNRVPKKNGGNPLLGWAFFAAILVGFRLLGLCAIGLALLVANQEMRDLLWRQLMAAPTELIFDVLCVLILGQYVLGKFMRLVFSPRNGKVYRAFFFFRRAVAPLNELNAVREDSQEFLGSPRYFFAASWRRDKLKPALQISPKVKNRNRLARFHHEIVPLLNAMLGSESSPAAVTEDDGDIAAEAVSVDTVEVPVDMADSVISGEVSLDEVVVAARSASVAAGAGSRDDARLSGGPKKTTKGTTSIRAGKKAKKYTMFEEKKGCYYPKGNPYYLLFAAVGLGLGIWQVVDPYHIILFFTAAGGLIGGLVGLVMSPIRTRLEPANNAVVVWTYVGLKKTVLGMDRLERIYLKNMGATKALCLTFEGQRHDPVIAEGSSIVKNRTAVREFGEIMGIDAERWLDA